jgi:hypothetical protein
LTPSLVASPSCILAVVDTPERCEWRRGCSGILLIAPHGGRRPPIDVTAPPARLRVNDLYTAEMTRALADRLSASVIINTTHDRNRLDLNRTSQILRRAPWFLDLLCAQLDAIVAHHGSAEVVLVHGWNVGQAKCDIGIGAVEVDGRLDVPQGACRTASDAYVRGRIAALQAACAAAGIRAAIGERYPGCHRNNPLQLFTIADPLPDDPAVRQIVGWARDGRLNALQLELGIPLRWPGTWREKFVNAFAGAFGERRTSGGLLKTGSNALRRAQGELVEASGGVFQQPARRKYPVKAGNRLSERGTDGSAQRNQPASLQFYDPVADVGLFAGVARAGARSTSGRLLLLLGGQRVALFTGEDASLQGTRVAPLEFAADDAGLRLCFRGPMLLLDDGTRYLDLEAALGASQLTEAHVELEFTPIQQRLSDPMPQFGCVTGQIRIGDRTRPVRSEGFSNAGGLRAAGLRRQTMIAASFGAGRGVLARADEARRTPLALRFGDGGITALDGARITVSADGDLYTPEALRLACPGQLLLDGRPLSRMAILRPAGAQGYLRVTFGVAAYRWGDLTGHGLYEYARPVGAAGADE